MSPMNNRLLVPRQTPGLLDLVPGAAAAYSLRSLSNSYADPVVTVRRSSDDAEEGFTAAEVSDGTLAAFCGAGDGFVKTWHSQTGSNDATQTTAGYQPKIVSSGVLILEEGKPAIQFDGSDDRLVATGYKPSGTICVFSVFTYSALDAVRLPFSCHKGGTPSGGFSFFNYTPGYTKIALQTGLGGVWVDGVNVLNAGDFDTDQSLVVIQIKPGSTSLRMRGVEIISESDGEIAAGNDLIVGGNANTPGLNSFVGTEQELIIYPSDVSSQIELLEGQIAWSYSQ